jgi:hypothetical protein
MRWRAAQQLGCPHDKAISRDDNDGKNRHHDSRQKQKASQLFGFTLRVDVLGLFHDDSTNKGGANGARTFSSKVNVTQEFKVFA